MRLNKLILTLIVIFAFVLRIYSVANNPPSLTWDEVAWGYNTYALGTDAKDEFGRFLPYDYLESFGDFKPPLYAYLDILPVKIFGLSEFSVRLPSVVFGTLTVFLTYFLVREIFFSSKRREWYATASALLLAFSPWHINLSRAAFEANVSSFFLIFGVFAFLFAVRRNLWLMIFSASSFALSFYVFNTARIVAPLLVVVLGLFFFRKLIKKPIPTLAAFVVGIGLLLPILGFLLSPQASLRFKEVNIFSNPKVIEKANLEIKNDNNSALGKVLHNRRLKYSVSFLTHYFDNLSPTFLFIKGDGNPKFSTQDVGQLYLWSLPFLIIGSIMLFRKREGNWYLVPIWLVLAIIPAATARETPHALRIATALPTFQIFVAYGAVTAYFYLKERLRKKSLFAAAVGIVSLFYFLNVFYYLYGYYSHYAREYSGEWQYGYKEALNIAGQNEDKYSSIYVTTDLGRPYIYYLFYNKIDPEEFRRSSDVKRDAFGFVNVTRVGKYHFLKDSDMRPHENALYIGVPINLPARAKIKKTVNRLNGEPSLVIYTY